MLAPHIPLRMIAQYTPPHFTENNPDIEARKKSIELALANCRITRDVGTEQMNLAMDEDLRDDIHKMRAAALAAIPFGEAALRKSTLEDFNCAEKEFRIRYAILVSSVKAFLWDAGPASKRHLWPLVGDLM